MDDNSQLIGCYVREPAVNWDDAQSTKEFAKERGVLFGSYVWGKNGISTDLKKLKHVNYGKDLVRILLQFYVNPRVSELANIKEIETYRKKEKAIGVPVVVNENNFFSKSEAERRVFLRTAIKSKLVLVEEIVARKKLDTNIVKLQNDLQNVYSC